MSCRLSCSAFLFYLNILLPINFFSTLVVSAIVGNETDRLALLAFKDQIIDDPNGALTSWNDSLHFCQWKGVTCSRRHGQRVTILNLAGQGLVGPTSPDIANLSFLTGINLGKNKFHGPVPLSINRLSRLRYLNLSYNSYQGKFPANLTSKLQYIDLSYNGLFGVIPNDLHSLSRLVLLDLQNNNFTGGIPPSLGNLSSLNILRLAWNSLNGSIPSDLGRLRRPQILGLASAGLSGTIPPSLYNLSSIVKLSVANNQLHGTLPPDLGSTLPNLEVLYLDMNRLTGPLPISLPNASRITRLDFGYNSFSGSVPLNLGSLKDLNILTFRVNKLGGGSNANDLNFLHSLTNCSNLQLLGVSENYFRGELPNIISNLSNQLTYLRLGTNQIFGKIPLGIENLVGLAYLGIEENCITGNIPVGIGKLNKLQILNLRNNGFSGQIPSSLGNLTQLVQLDLSKNNLQGKVPLSLEYLRNLQELYLQSNNFSGVIPTQIFDLPSLSKCLNLSHNSFTGSIPSAIGSFTSLWELDISYNKLSGEIPNTFSNCLGLEYLFMEYNFLQGTIPSSLSTLKGLRKLDLSFNDLEGEVPKEGIFRNTSAISIFGNNKLCGGISELQLPPCPERVYKKHGRSHSLRVMISVTSVVVGLMISLSIIATFTWTRKLRKRPLSKSFLEEQCIKVSYGELLRATNRFSLENLLGAGSYGSVYKGTLSVDGLVVAVKVLNLQQRGASESFKAECDALRNARHRNLVKILTSCSSIDFNGNNFKALVFEYMPNGSLEKWLHQIEGKQQTLKKLSFIERVNIAIDVAFALNYLHDHCQVPIVHRDLKPSNILFDEEMNAHVGDFGLSKLLSSTIDKCCDCQTNSARINGSIGYVAPEYGMGSKASIHGDVYSYGILLLEIFTGKRPTDHIFKDGLTLYQFAKMAVPSQVIEIADPGLLLEVEATGNNNNDEHNVNVRNKLQDCLTAVFMIGISCCAESPTNRMDMEDVIMKMITIKDSYLRI